MINLKIVFEIELVEKPKSLNLALLISQAKLKLNIKLKLELKSSFWAWDLKKITLLNAYVGSQIVAQIQME